MADLSVDYAEMDDIMNCLSEALEAFDQFGHVTSKSLADGISPAMSWVEMLFARPEEELLREPDGQHFALRRLSLPYLLMKSLLKEDGADLENLSRYMLRIYKRVEQGKMCLRAQLRELHLFLDTIQLILLGLRSEVGAAEEELPLLVLDVELDRAQARLVLEGVEMVVEEMLDGDELQELIFEKAKSPDYAFLVYVDELKEGVRRYSVIATAPHRPNPLGAQYNEDGYPEKMTDRTRSILEMVLAFEGVAHVGFVGGAIIVLLKQGYDWHKDEIDKKTLATISDHFEVNCDVYYSEIRLAPPDEGFEGVGT